MKEKFRNSFDADMSVPLTPSRKYDLRVLTERVVEKALNLYGLKDLTSYDLLDGVDNIVVRVSVEDQTYILRFWCHDQTWARALTDEDIEDEVALMRWFYKCGLPVPLIYSSRAGRLWEKLINNNFLFRLALMEYVPGQILMQVSMKQAEQIGQIAARLHIAVREFTLPHGRKMRLDLPGMATLRAVRILEGVYGLRSNLSPYRLWLASLLADFQSVSINSHNYLPRLALHGDLVSGNLLWQTEELVALIDFSDCRQSNCLDDLAMAVTYRIETEDSLFGVDGTRVLSLLQGYEKIRPLTINERESVKYFLSASFLYRFASVLIRAYREPTTNLPPLEHWIKRREMLLCVVEN